MIRHEIRGVSRAALVACVAGMAICSPALAQLASYDITNIDWLRAQGLNGAGINIGQIESGTTAQHTSITPRIGATQAGGAGATLHGTHVAGIMVSNAANYGGTNVYGVANGATLYGSFAGAGGANFANAMDWMVTAPEADTINVSWGLNAPNGITTTADWTANKKKKLVVVAADNSNGGAINAPDDGFNVLSIGGTGGTSNPAGPVQNRVTGDWTARGPAANGLRKPDLVAPGRLIFSASNIDHNGNAKLDDFHNSDFPGGQEVTGNSFAAPHVTGTSALLMQYSKTKAWSAQGMDPKTQRAVLINGASKNVTDRAGSRWDAAMSTPTQVRAAAQPLDASNGAGLLDARRSYEILKAGPASPNTKFDVNGFPIFNGVAQTPAVGWSSESVLANSKVLWKTQKDLRKGTYLTSTLAWERVMNGADAGAAAYARALGDLALNIRRDNDSLLASSDTSNNSVEHVVAKLDGRGKHTIEVKSFSGSSEDFAVAWHSYEAPTEFKHFNGDFMGDRGALNDNGWFDTSLHGTSGIGKPSFTNQALDESFAMKFTPNSLGNYTAMSQEAIVPTEGLWLKFSLTYDIAAGPINDGAVRLQLGGVDLLTAAGFNNGRITPDATNTGRYRTYELSLTQAQLQTIVAGLPDASVFTGFQNLEFQSTGYGGAMVFIDNIQYQIPAPGFGVFAIAGLMGASRRRRA